MLGHLSSKTNVFEDKLTRYWSVCLVVSLGVADIQMECYIFVYRIYSFSISEEYVSVQCRNYASRQISESYAERILFFIFIYLFIL